MAKTKRKKHGAAAYTVALLVYTLLLLVGAFFALTKVWTYAEEYEAARPELTMDAYIENLSRNLWNDSVADTISAMPHEVQTDEECKELVKQMLSAELSYSRRAGGGEDTDSVSYNLLCGGNVFGKVVLVRDESKAAELEFDLLPWKVDKEEFDFNGLYSAVQITVPESYSVKLNGVTLGEEYIIERDIPYDVLKDYYAQYPQLPKKVTYRFENIFGHLEPVVYNEQGEETVIDDTRDDSQYIKPVDEAVMAQLREFTVAFSDAYLNYCAGTSDPVYAYNKLAPYIQLGGDLDARLHQAMDGYTSWSHTTSYRFESATLNKATDVGDGYYILEISAITTTTFPNHGENGVVTTNNGMTVIVHKTADEVRAVAVERYDADETS